MLRRQPVLTEAPPTERAMRWPTLSRAAPATLRRQTAARRRLETPSRSTHSRSQRPSGTPASRWVWPTSFRTPKDRLNRSRGYRIGSGAGQNHEGGRRQVRRLKVRSYPHDAGKDGPSAEADGERADGPVGPSDREGLLEETGDGYRRLKRLFPKSANMVPDEIGRLWSSRSRRDRGLHART